MNIHIGQIREDEGLSVHHHYPEGEPALEGSESRIIGEPLLSLHASRDGQKVKLTGSIEANVEIECDRCLSSVIVPVDQSFDLLYVPPLRPGSPDDEKELADQDLSVGFYQDQLIDIDDVVREQIELALPMARLCSEECQGLCANCGANLNQGRCACTSEEIDPRWAALKEFKSE